MKNPTRTTLTWRLPYLGDHWQEFVLLEELPMLWQWGTRGETKGDPLLCSQDRPYMPGATGEETLQDTSSAKDEVTGRTAHSYKPQHYAFTAMTPKQKNKIKFHKITTIIICNVTVVKLKRQFTDMHQYLMTERNGSWLVKFNPHTKTVTIIVCNLMWAKHLNRFDEEACHKHAYNENNWSWYQTLDHCATKKYLVWKTSRPSASTRAYILLSQLLKWNPVMPKNCNAKHFNKAWGQLHARHKSLHS